MASKGYENGELSSGKSDGDTREVLDKPVVSSEDIEETKTLDRLASEPEEELATKGDFLESETLERSFTALVDDSTAISEVEIAESKSISTSDESKETLTEPAEKPSLVVTTDLLDSDSMELSLAEVEAEREAFEINLETETDSLLEFSSVEMAIGPPEQMPPEVTEDSEGELVEKTAPIEEVGSEKSVPETQAEKDIDLEKPEATADIPLEASRDEITEAASLPDDNPPMPSPWQYGHDPNLIDYPIEPEVIAASGDMVGVPSEKIDQITIQPGVETGSTLVDYGADSVLGGFDFEGEVEGELPESERGDRSRDQNETEVNLEEAARQAVKEAEDAARDAERYESIADEANADVVELKELLIELQGIDSTSGLPIEINGKVITSTEELDSAIKETQFSLIEKEEIAAIREEEAEAAQEEARDAERIAKSAVATALGEEPSDPRGDPLIG